MEIRILIVRQKAFALRLLAILLPISLKTWRTKVFKKKKNDELGTLLALYARCRKAIGGICLGIFAIMAFLSLMAEQVEPGTHEPHFVYILALIAAMVWVLMSLWVKLDMTTDTKTYWLNVASMSMFLAVYLLVHLLTGSSAEYEQTLAYYLYDFSVGLFALTWIIVDVIDTLFIIRTR